MATDNYLKFPQNPQTKKSKIVEKLNYFQTSRGRYFSYKFMGAIALGVGSLWYASDTILISQYINFIRAYRNGLPVEVPENLELIIDAASDKAKLPPKEVVNLKSFVVSGFDTKTCGSVNSTYYGWVGLPLNFFYDSTRDIDRLNMKLRNQTIDWNGKYGALLENSLVLTEDEKLFGITRAVLELRNYNYVHQSLIPTFTVFGLYCSAQALNKKLNLFQAPRVGRFSAYGLLSVFAYGIYTCVTDFIRIQQATRVDKQLASMDKDMIEAGIRYYEKVLNKNIAIRELSGSDLYSVKGNEYPGYLRFNNLPLTTRKLYLETALEEIRKKEAEQKNEFVESESKTNTK